MEVEILYRPSYSIAVLRLMANESVIAESGAMVSMSAGINIQTQASGGLLRSLARTFLGKESFWQNTFTAPEQGGEVWVAPALPGDIFSLALNNEAILIQSGSYLAAEQSVEINTKWGGPRTFFASEGLFMIQAAGTGKIVLASYGAIHERELEEGETVTVDTGHLVAFTQKIGYKLRAIGGIKSTLLSGEGLVVDLTGPGRFWLQTRSTDAFISWLAPKLPKVEAPTR